MKVIIQTILFIMAITMAITLLLDHSPAKSVSVQQSKATSVDHPILMPTKRVSRFLQQKARNPNAANHCNKDHEVCNDYLVEGRNATCCSNKCVDLAYDDQNCNACKNKCRVTEVCCNGKCVNMSFDKRHCGFCNNKCMKNGYCIYGICDYA